MPKSKKHSCYAGKILRINLSNGKIETEPTSKFASDWLGSSGIAIKILYDELYSWVSPFDPANKIVFGTGVLQGTIAPGACKMTVSTLSPMTNGWTSGASDSYVGGYLKCAGYDLLVISGKSCKPVYLYIEDNLVEIRDANNLWGKTTWETIDILRDDLKDPSLHAICIGPAGENLVRGACIIQDKVRAFGRGGAGAVMGSKNLKAIIAKGSGGVHVAQPERFMTIVNQLRGKIINSETAKKMKKYGTYSSFEAKQKAFSLPYKNFQFVTIPEDLARIIDPRKVVDKYQIGRSCFPGCPIGCGQTLRLDDGNFSGLTTEKSQWEVFSTLQTRLAVADPQFMIKANALANQLGIDVDMLGGSIGWAMECFEKGIITEKDTDGLKLNWGDVEVILKLFEKISSREGFGDLLAEGCARASEILGRKSKYYCMQIKQQELYESLRGAMAWALGTVVSTRGGGHTTGTPHLETVGRLDPEKMAGLYGIDPKDVDPLTYEGKPEIVIFTESIHRAANSLGICHFNTVWNDLDFIGLADMAELVSSATGMEISVEDIRTITLRQINLEKAFNIRHAKFSRKDDLPTPRDLAEPIPSGNLKGWKIEIDKWNVMLDKYYQLHGWDLKTGYPLKQTLGDLGIGSVYEDIQNMN
jgi:aldehyde:ferredoxin oxidoreductase